MHWVQIKSAGHEGRVGVIFRKAGGLRDITSTPGVPERETLVWYVGDGGGGGWGARGVR